MFKKKNNLMPRVPRVRIVQSFSSFRLHNVLMCVAFTVLLFSDCVRSSGVDYRGEQRSSSSGLTCLDWTNTTRDYDVNVHPDSQTGKQMSVDAFKFKCWLILSCFAQVET